MHPIMIMHCARTAPCSTLSQARIAFISLRILHVTMLEESQLEASLWLVYNPAISAFRLHRASFKCPLKQQALYAEEISGGLCTISSHMC